MFKCEVENRLRLIKLDGEWLQTKLSLYCTKNICKNNNNDNISPSSFVKKKNKESFLKKSWKSCIILKTLLNLKSCWSIIWNPNRVHLKLVKWHKVEKVLIHSGSPINTQICMPPHINTHSWLHLRRQALPLCGKAALKGVSHWQRHWYWATLPLLLLCHHCFQ